MNDKIFLVVEIPHTLPAAIEDYGDAEYFIDRVRHVENSRNGGADWNRFVSRQDLISDVGNAGEAKELYPEAWEMLGEGKPVIVSNTGYGADDRTYFEGEGDSELEWAMEVARSDLYGMLVFVTPDEVREYLAKQTYGHQADRVKFLLEKWMQEQVD